MKQLYKCKWKIHLKGHDDEMKPLENAFLVFFFFFFFLIWLNKVR